MMTALLKDRYKIGLLLGSLFFVGIIASVYTLFALPHNVSLNDVLHPAFVRSYLIIAITFIIGALSIWYALQHRNEVIVYRDRQIDATTADNGSTNASQTTISLESVKASLKPSVDKEENFNAGLHAVCKQLEAGQGAVYMSVESSEGRKLELTSGYALSIGENTVIAYAYGEGLIGQAAAGARTLYIDEVPEGYIKIISGLGSASPRYLLIVPVKNNDRVLGVMEIASFTPISEDQRKFVEESAQLIATTVAGN
jgi:putative methionine-R-sulfoxide reductase with GAF domain